MKQSVEGRDTLQTAQWKVPTMVQIGRLLKKRSDDEMLRKYSSINAQEILNHTWQRRALKSMTSNSPLRSTMEGKFS